MDRVFAFFTNTIRNSTLPCAAGNDDYGGGRPLAKVEPRSRERAHFTMRRLSNYLRKHRKRLGLTQDDVAFLLGAVQGAKVSRYEQFVRVPLLEAALALEAIFEIPVRELFAGLYEEAEDKVQTRARKLSGKAKEFSGPGANRRKQSVDKLAKRKTN